jgi:hypothetical protein
MPHERRRGAGLALPAVHLRKAILGHPHRGGLCGGHRETNIPGFPLSHNL